jgi:hypothetical protein
MAHDDEWWKSAPDTWRTCRGPANWFTFRCPEEFEVRQNQTLIEIPLKRVSLPNQSEPLSMLRAENRPRTPVLSLVTWWDESGSDASRRQTPDLGLLFPTVVALQPGLSLPIDVANETWAGRSRRPAAGPWYQRWFAARPHYEWRLWTIRHGRLTIVATVQSPDGRPLDAALVQLCEQILSSLQLADRPAWPPDVFLKQVIELARQSFPLLQSSAARGFSLRLGQSEISLSNFYRMYLQQPDHFRRIVLPGLTTVVRLQELGPGQLAPELAQVRDRILPMLSADDEPRADERIRVPWVGGLSVGYVVDEDDSYRYIHQRMLDTWGLSQDDLHELAMTNLRTYSAEHPLEVTMVGDEDEPRMLMPVHPDAYNCSRILDPAFHGRLRDLFGPELVIGVPNRDFFVAVSIHDDDLIEQVRARVREDYAAMHHPLTRRLLVISADGVSEFCSS